MRRPARMQGKSSHLARTCPKMSPTATVAGSRRGARCSRGAHPKVPRTPMRSVGWVLKPTYAFCSNMLQAATIECGARVLRWHIMAKEADIPTLSKSQAIPQLLFARISASCNLKSQQDILHNLLISVNSLAGRDRQQERQGSPFPPGQPPSSPSQLYQVSSA